MYEELIKNLRAVNEYDTGYAKLIYEAADAIEELSKRKECPYWFEDTGACNMLGKCIVKPPKEET